MDPTFHDKARYFFPSYQRLTAPGKTHDMEQFNRIINLFSQAVFTVSNRHCPSLINTTYQNVEFQ